MGFEYKIAFRGSDPDELELFLKRLRETEGSASEWLDYQVELEPDGFYFCDNTKSRRPSHVFRILIDKALTHSEVIVHQL